MAVYREDIRDINFEKTVVTVGSFDGVHSGHRLLLKRVVDLASQNNLRSVVLTFWPHPRYVLAATHDPTPTLPKGEGVEPAPENNSPMLLNTLDEKITLLNQCGVEDVIVFPFDKTFSQMSAHDFIRDIIIGKLNAQHIVVGQDHHFGNGRSGNVQYLPEIAKKNNLHIDVVYLKTLDGKISSSEIRNALLYGDINLANKMLGYEYMISGKVINGRRLGRTIGFPTANIETPDYKLLPKEGVYRVKINNFDKLGMLYIGKRIMNKQKYAIPSVDRVGKGLEKIHIEVNIFDFDQQIYGQEITLALTHYIRDNTRFENVEQLAEQLNKDKQNILTIL